MGTKETNPLVESYENRIGVPSTADEAYGYWVFALGVIAGFVGIALVMSTGEPGANPRGFGIALASLGLILLLIGPTIRLPLKTAAMYLSLLGAVIGVVGIAWFLVAFLNGNWSASFENSEVMIIGLYGAGIFIISLGSVFVPVLMSPREEQEAAEQRAAEAEAERDAAASEVERQSRAAEESAAEAERQADEAERQSRAAEQSAAEAERQAAEVARLEDELSRIEDSQSQFELYTDRGTKHRWRLRHRNGNIIADSAQGYASRQGAQRGLTAVRRDAFGAGVIDLDKTETPIEESDEAAEGDDAPEFVADAESRAEFEVYEDSEGKHRWRLRHENGNIIADSGQGYSSKSTRDDAVERVAAYAKSADYLRIEPAAFEVYRDAAGEHRWRLLHENGNIIADGGEGYSSRAKARQGIESVKANAAEGENAEFEVYEDNAGEHRWRLRHANGNIIADGGEGYSSKSAAESAVERVRDYAPEAHALDVGSAAFEIFEDAEGKWRWRLRHRNGNILADSGQGYASRNGAEDGIASVKQNGPNADVAEVEN